VYQVHSRQVEAAIIPIFCTTKLKFEGLRNWFFYLSIRKGMAVIRNFCQLD